jgi:hypothetical protein
VTRPAPPTLASHQPHANEASMGKYFLAWLFGVPALLLLLVYFFFN